MRQVPSHRLWIGHAGDGRDLKGILDLGIEAVVDLAASEPPPTITRDLIYCRFPIADSSENSPAVLKLAIETVYRLLQANMPTLVFCCLGMSRSPAIAASALSKLLHRDPDECLRMVTTGAPSNVVPGLWQSIRAAIANPID